MCFPFSRSAAARQTRPACWPGRFVCRSRERAKTSGPARALANNANANDGEGRSHAPLLWLRRPVAVKSHRRTGLGRPRPASYKDNILLNMSIEVRGLTRPDGRWCHDFAQLIGEHPTHQEDRFGADNAKDQETG